MFFYTFITKQTNKKKTFALTLEVLYSNQRSKYDERMKSSISMQLKSTHHGTIMMDTAAKQRKRRKKQKMNNDTTAVEQYTNSRTSNNNVKHRKEKKQLSIA